MTIDDLNQLATKQDLENLKVEILAKLLSKINPIKEFLTPKEFAGKTGIPYSTVIYKCKIGKLKAFQDGPNCGWLIYATELERFKNEAIENLDSF
jgi:hypothetical protein